MRVRFPPPLVPAEARRRRAKEGKRCLSTPTPRALLSRSGIRLHYVYLLRSVADPTQRYVGVTSNLRRRLVSHNAGKSAHTSRYRPWVLVTFVGFREAGKAIAFERYLKSGSGRAFANRRFW